MIYYIYMKMDSSQVITLIDFVKSFHLYSRYEMAKSLQSPLMYGSDFGDKKLLQLAKVDFLKNETNYRNGGNPEKQSTENKQTGNVFLFKNNEPQEYKPAIMRLEIVASNKKLSAFLGKNYILDISPEYVFIIFPDLTFSISMEFFIQNKWEDIRAELQDADLLDKDIAHLSGDTISIDQLRKKLNNTTYTDGTLMDIRKSMYGFAYAISESFHNQIVKYEK